MAARPPHVGAGAPPAALKAAGEGRADPVIEGGPGDTTVECDNIPPPETLTASDNCDGDVPVVFSQVSTKDESACAGEYTITRTWTATDCSGNTASHVQTITVQDTSDPVLSGVPADVIVECSAVPPPAIVTATDNCDPNPVVTPTSVTIPGACADEYIIQRTWTATDCSGNVASKTQTVTVVDTTAPVIDGVPGDELVECDAVPAPVVLTATDNCGPAPEVIFGQTRTDGNCEFNYVLTRTWSATDRCGRTTTVSQQVEVQDSTPPVIEMCPEHDTIDICVEAVGVAPTLTVTDNCGAPTTVDASCCFDGTGVTRTYSIEDSCGNAAVDCTQMITFNPICATA